MASVEVSHAPSAVGEPTKPPEFTAGTIKGRCSCWESESPATTRGPRGSPRRKPLRLGVVGARVPRKAGRGGVRWRRNEKRIRRAGSREAAFALLSARPATPPTFPQTPQYLGSCVWKIPLGDVPGVTLELLWAPGTNAHGWRAVAVGLSRPRPKARGAAGWWPVLSDKAAGLPQIWS